MTIHPVRDEKHEAAIVSLYRFDTENDRDRAKECISISRLRDALYPDTDLLHRIAAEAAATERAARICDEVAASHRGAPFAVKIAAERIRETQP